jgi:hypothetical protein
VGRDTAEGSRCFSLDYDRDPFADQLIRLLVKVIHGEGDVLNTLPFAFQEFLVA